MNAFRLLHQLLSANRRRSTYANRRKLRSGIAAAHGFETLESRQLLTADLGVDAYFMPGGFEGAPSAGDGHAAIVAQPQLAVSSVAGWPPTALEVPIAARFDASVHVGHAGNVIYVNDDATGANDGTSWEDAFNDLQDGLWAAAASVGSDEIWVAEGVYKPTAFADRFASFNLPDEVSVLGGFAASSEEPSLRDAEQYRTVLSGDIGVAGSAFDNSYNVVRVNGSTAVLSGVTVEGGNANGSSSTFQSGGGIRADFGASLAVSDVVIANNSAVNAGGGIFTSGYSLISISQSLIANNSSRFGGGALFDNSLADVHASSFSDNFAASQGGGFYGFFSTVTIVDSSVVENSAQSSGGGVYGANAQLEFIDTDILSNFTGGTGGGLLASGASLIFDGGLVVGNGAGNNGGGLYPLNATTIITNTVFRENSSGAFGGGLQVRGGSATVEGSQFYGNTAMFDGGGIQVDGSNTSATISDVIVENNTARNGGGIANTDASMSLSSSVVSNNAAQLNGGGLYGLRAQLQFIETDILSNSAGGTGGGILASGGSLIFDGGLVMGNGAGNNGGGIYPFNATTIITDTVFRENSSGAFGGGLQVRGGSATVEGSQFYGNTAMFNGGGMNVDGSNTSATISDVIVENNSARNGGGIANTGSSMSLSNSVVSNNAAKFGGGIIHQFSSLVMTNVAVANNKAEENAGGLLNFRGQVFIDSSEFDGNQALGLNTENFPFGVGRGGAIENVGANFGSLIEIRNSVFHRNFAANEGGAIVNNGVASKLVMADSRVSQNKTGGNGGGLFNEGLALIEGVHFASNVAQQFGGAIFVASGQVAVNHSRLTGNKAKLDLGSAVYVGLDGNLLLDELTVVSQNGIPIYFES